MCADAPCAAALRISVDSSSVLPEASLLRRASWNRRPARQPLDAKVGNTAKNPYAPQRKTLAKDLQCNPDMTNAAADRKFDYDQLLDVEAANDVFRCSPDDPIAGMALVRQIAASVARRLPSHVDRDELVGLGTLGWAEARQRFDASRGVPFAGFAAARIRGAILDGLRRADTLSRGDRRRAQRDSQPALPRIVSDPAEVEAAMDRSSDDGDVSDVLAQQEMVDELRTAMTKLPERERLVLLRHFFDDVPMRVIGAELGVTESRVSQIATAAVEKLRGTFGIAVLPRKKTRKTAEKKSVKVAAATVATSVATSATQAA
ncbi:MAG TPA: sigma-70 family RNA polymerase sigma factor [Polyangia bacterium]|nr:sigma-70 family RNA polymerase sigma factor [Polyangia bacterium]